MEKFQLDVGQEYQNLQKMIKQTSNLFERLVQEQGQAICLQYSRWTLFLCLIRQVDGKGQCCGVRWAKYRLANDSRKAWYNGWLPGKVPASTAGRVPPEEKTRFQEMDKYAKQLAKFRNELVSKKKRIAGTFQSVRTHDEPRLKDLVQGIELVQDFEMPEEDESPDISIDESLTMS